MGIQNCLVPLGTFLEQRSTGNYPSSDQFDIRGYNRAPLRKRRGGRIEKADPKGAGIQIIHG